MHICECVRIAVKERAQHESSARRAAQAPQSQGRSTRAYTPKRRDIVSDYFTPNNRKERNLVCLRPRAARRGKRVNHLRQLRKQTNTMEDKIKEKKITGPGGIGTSRPDTAETTFAGSLSSGCKTTACGVDPRPPGSQWTTGTNLTANMTSQEKGNKITSAGEIGGPRPGAEGIQLVPSASSSHDHKGEQVEDQACSSASSWRSTGARNARQRRPVKTQWP